MSRSLNKIEVKGFKSIKAMSLKLSPLNILIGANGTGKSNFIGLFKMLNQIVERNLQVFVATSGGANSLLYFGRKSTNQIDIQLSFAEDTNGYNCELIPTVDDNLTFQSEECWFHNKSSYPKPFIVPLQSGGKETGLYDEAAKPRGYIAKYVLDDLRSWKVYHFHDTSSNALVKQTSDLNDNKILQPDAGNLAAFLFWLRKQSPNHYKNIIDAVKQVAPFFDDFILEPSNLNKEKIRLEWKELGSDSYFNAASLSDGTLRFICIATLLLQPILPSTILLDEPELGLHPYAIVILAELLRSASTKTQVIVSTQSVTLVNHFEPKDLIVVEREEYASVFRHLSESETQHWLDDYGLGELWEKNVLGGRP